MRAARRGRGRCAGGHQPLKAQGRKDPAAHVGVAPALRRGYGRRRIVELVRSPPALQGGVRPHQRRPGGSDLPRRQAAGAAGGGRDLSAIPTLHGRRTGPRWPLCLDQPPLRFQEDIDQLWEGIKDGTIDYVGTDHSPLIVSDKESGGRISGDARRSAGG